MRGPVLSTGCAWSTVVSSTGAERPALSAGAARLSGRAVFRTAAVFGVAATTFFFFENRSVFGDVFIFLFILFRAFLPFLEGRPILVCARTRTAHRFTSLQFDFCERRRFRLGMSCSWIKPPPLPACLPKIGMALHADQFPKSVSYDDIYVFSDTAPLLTVISDQ